MALDGAFLHILVNELKAAESAFVEKIHQPSKDELVILLRKKGFSKKLYMCASPNRAVIKFTDEKNYNPQNPPMFCMLLRKHLGSARLVEISQPSLERVVILSFSALSELGDREDVKIILELLSGRPNIILVGGNGRIIDSVYRSDFEKNTRIIQPGATYTLPESQNKHSVLESDIDALACLILNQGEKPLDKAILSSLDGVSPLIARELAYISATDIDTPANLCQKEKIKNALIKMKNHITHADGLCALYTQNGDIFDFSYMPITQYKNAYTLKSFALCTDTLDEFFTKKQGLKVTEQKAKDIIKLLTTVRTRILRKTELRKKDLAKCENREQLRLYGELLKANLHLIASGAPFADVQNYYDEALNNIRIPLNPALSPAANAAKYFKDYKKTYSAEQTLTSLIEQDKKELEYIDSVLEVVERTFSAAELDEIKEELMLSGYIKTAKMPNRNKNSISKPLKFISESGTEVYVGKNNLQNDYLTLKFASKSDYWFHTKNIPGSHVIAVCPDGQINDNDILFAATLAKQHSKAAKSSKVAVDYTQIKHVKKPSGAKPGMVIYLTNKTILID